MSLGLLLGTGLIAVMVAMIWIGRPTKGTDRAPWLGVWILGQIYILAALVCAVSGLTLLIQNWP